MNEVVEFILVFLSTICISGGLIWGTVLYASYRVEKDFENYKKKLEKQKTTTVEE